MGPQADLDTFLRRNVPMAEEQVAWGGGTVPLRLASYLSRELPPLDFVTSVRGVVTSADQVLVVRDPESLHILPGGHREDGETLLETLRRELLEETGWTIDDVSLVGFQHYHHLGPRPRQARRYPHFIHLIYGARPASFHPDRREPDEYVLDAQLLPHGELPAIGITPAELNFLEATLRIRANG